MLYFSHPLQQPAVSSIPFAILTGALPSLEDRFEVVQYQQEMPGPKVSKAVPSDAKITISIPRSHFNELATKGRVKDWREAFVHGDAKATGIEQVLKLIVSVVDRQEERARTRKASHR